MQIRVEFNGEKFKRSEITISNEIENLHVLFLKSSKNRQQPINYRQSFLNQTQVNLGC